MSFGKGLVEEKIHCKFYVCGPWNPDDLLITPDLILQSKYVHEKPGVPEGTAEWVPDLVVMTSNFNMQADHSKCNQHTHFDETQFRGISD